MFNVDFKLLVEHLLLALPEGAAEFEAVPEWSFFASCLVHIFFMIVLQSFALLPSSPDWAWALNFFITSVFIKISFNFLTSQLLHVRSEVFGCSLVDEEWKIVMVVPHDGFSVLFALQLLNWDAQGCNLLVFESSLGGHVRQKVLGLDQQENCKRHDEYCRN